MPLSNKDTNSLNKDAQQVINFIGVAQTDYFDKHGEYFQLLVSPEIPFDMSTLQDLTVRHPSDERWVEDKITSYVAQMPFQVAVHESSGGVNPTARGYQIVFTATVGTETYERVVHSDGVDTGWLELIKDQIV